MKGNFDPMLEYLRDRNVIDDKERESLHTITTSGRDTEAYTMARDYIVETYYSEKALADIPKGD